MSSPFGSMTSALRAVPAAEQCLPVGEVWSALLPDGALRRGRVVGCFGPAAMTMALSIVARSVTTGSWLAVVGVDDLGIEAACELGVPPSRLVVVEGGTDATGWAERIAASVDGFDVVLTTPPPAADRHARRLANRVQSRGAVLVVVGGAGRRYACDVELTTPHVAWSGIGAGWGALGCRRAVVRVAGRRVPRPVERDLLLPGASGTVEYGSSVDADAVAERDAGLVLPLRQVV